MNERSFRAQLTDLGARTADSYVSIARRIERELALDLETADLGPNGLAALEARLRSLHPSAAGGKHVGDCVSVLRAYAGERTPRARRTPRPSTPEAPTPDTTPRSAAIRTATVAGLLAIHGEVMDELFDRGVLRTGNPPAGDYAEHLFIRAFGWRLHPNSASGADATDDDGVRYQIKGRLVTARNTSRQLSSLRRLPEHTFDVLAGVVFGPGHTVARAALVPWAVVEAGATYVAHTNSWRFMLEDRVWREPGVRDVTVALTAAAASL